MDSKDANKQKRYHQNVFSKPQINRTIGSNTVATACFRAQFFENLRAVEGLELPTFDRNF